MTIRKNMSIYDCLINRFNMAKKQIFANNINLQLPRINNNVQSAEYVLKRFKGHNKDTFYDLRNFISFFKKEENIENAINLVIEYTKQLIIRAEEKELIDFMISAKNIDVFLSMLKKQNKNIGTAGEKILYIRKIIEEKEKSDKLKADLRYGHYQINNNSQNEWDKLPTCETPQWDSVVNDFKECKKDNFDELKKFVASYEEEKDINKAINLVINYTKNLIIKDIQEILNAKQAKDFIRAQNANSIANFMGSNKNINLFLKNLSEQKNNNDIQNIRNIMQDAKYMITQEEQRNSSITRVSSDWSIDGSRGSNYSGSNVTTDTLSAISGSNSSRLWCSTPNSKTKLPPLTISDSHIFPRR